jgi:hypothetical protein
VNNDETIMFDLVTGLLADYEAGWVDPASMVDQIKALYLELRGPDALRDTDDQLLDCN